MLIIQEIKFYNILLFWKYLKIRYRAFVIGDQRPFFEEYSLKDFEAKHYILIVNQSIVGSARIICGSNEIELGRFAIKPEYQGQHYGQSFLQLLKTQYQNSIKKIHIIVKKELIDFYKKFDFTLLGDIKIKGQLYYTMSYTF